MPKALPFFKFDADAWLTGKIQLLSAQEKGIFIDLVARMWKENGSLKNDDVLPRLVRVPKATLAKSLEAYFQLGIMVEKDHVLSVKFVDAQLEARREYAEKQRVFGGMRGKKRKGSLTVASATQKKQQGYPFEEKKEKNPPASPCKEKTREFLTDSAESVSPEPGNPGNPGKRTPEKIFFDYDGDARIHGITQQQLDLWKENFPAVDVETELKSASAWLDGNRKNRKTDVKRFLVNWLKRQQDRAPRVTEPPRGAGEGEWRV